MKSSPTPESQKAIYRLLIAARIKAVLMPIKPDIEVVTEDGVVSVKVKASEFEEEKELVHKIEQTAKNVHGVKVVEVHVEPYGL